jgi:hypothetical protein
MAKGKRNLTIEARWRRLVEQHRTSGLSVRAFCARQRVTEPGFYAWRREIGRRDLEGKATPAFVPVVLPRAKPPENDGHIVIELRGQRVLRLPPELSMARVTELVRAIEAAS